MKDIFGGIGGHLCCWLNIEDALIMFEFCYSGDCLNQYSSLMGCCLKLTSREEEHQPPTKVVISKQPDTDRTSLCQTKTDNHKEQSICGSRMSHMDGQSNSSVRETKIFWKTKSTALFSTNRGNSSIQQMTIDHDSMIVKDVALNNKETQDFYMIAEKVAFLKKTGDCLKVNMPDGQSQINCGPQHLFSVITISEGKPADCLEEVGPNRYIMNQESPIRLKLKLKCEHCKKQLKISYCISVVNIKTTQCPYCQKTGQWSIQDIESNYPVWGGGAKIDNHQKVEPAPSTIRAMGCVCCFRFTNWEKMRCGCYLCRQCIENQKLSVEEQCWMCQDRSYIL